MLDKTANTTYPIQDIIARRWSPRAFADKPVEVEKLQQLFEAARWTPSAFNEQPWRFIVATKDDTEAYQNILSCLGEFNQAWAKSAPVLMLAVASTKFERNGKPNAHALYDTGQAMAALSVQATALDLYIHQMAGFSADKARELFHIPHDYEAIVSAAIGYQGNPDNLPAPMREQEIAPRSRKSLSEIVFTDSWDLTSQFASEQ